MITKTPFDHVKAINTKSYPNFNSDETQTTYVPFIINRTFSYHKDSVLFADELNRFSNLPKKAQFDFYYYGLEKRNRFSRWSKPDNDDIVNELATITNLNKSRIKEYLSLMNKEQLKELTLKLNKVNKNDKSS